jgi:cytochrome P450
MISDFPVRAGQVVMLSPFAANRDPAVFEDPGKILQRPNLDTGLAFAAGAHVCVGLRMSRNIVRCAFNALAALPQMRLAGAGVQGSGRAVRTLVSLPVELQ